MTRFIMYWALAGAFVPVLVLILGQAEAFLGRVFDWLAFAVFVWPSWIFMGATYGREFTPMGILILLISLAVNVLLYTAVGALFWVIFLRRSGG